MRIVSARSNDLEDLHPRIHAGGMISHGCSTSCDLLCGLRPGTLCGKCRQKCRILCGGRLAAHDLIHNGIRLIITQVFLVYDLHDCFLDHFSLLVPSAGSLFFIPGIPCDLYPSGSPGPLFPGFLVSFILPDPLGHYSLDPLYPLFFRVPRGFIPLVPCILFPSGIPGLHSRSSGGVPRKFSNILFPSGVRMDSG